MMLTKVESLIKKRNNKLLDYDRHRDAYAKMTGKGTVHSTLNDEKKLLKVSERASTSNGVCQRFCYLTNNIL